MFAIVNDTSITSFIQRNYDTWPPNFAMYVFPILILDLLLFRYNFNNMETSGWGVGNFEGRETLQNS